MDIAVIICAYTLDRWELLSEAVAAVRRQTLAPKDVILVIDGNEELQARAERELTGAIVLANRHGHGLSGGRQTGADHTTAEILAFLDDDAIPEPQWLEQMLAAYDDPQTLGAGGEVQPLWLTEPPQWLPKELYWIVGCTYAGMPVTDGRIRNPIGANMSLRADVLARAGTFAPSLARLNRGKSVSGTAEETEFSIRAVRMFPNGYWAYRPDARVHHAVPAERTTWAYFVRRCRLEASAKAVLTGLTGTGPGLSSERAYARDILPRAFLRELRAAARGDTTALRRAGAIAAGLTITAVSYLEQRVRLALVRRAPN